MPKVIDSFFKTVKERPDAPVLNDCASVNLSYSELDVLSGQVYRYLKENGIGREDFVMILLPRGVLPFVVMLGVWKAGAAFVAIDLIMPPFMILFALGLMFGAGANAQVSQYLGKETIEAEERLFRFQQQP